jgi:hypothetical protein
LWIPAVLGFILASVSICGSFGFAPLEARFKTIMKEPVVTAFLMLWHMEALLRLARRRLTGFHRLTLFGLHGRQVAVAMVDSVFIRRFLGELGQSRGALGAGGSD